MVQNASGTTLTILFGLSNVSITYTVSLPATTHRRPNSPAKGVIKPTANVNDRIKTSAAHTAYCGHARTNPRTMYLQPEQMWRDMSGLTTRSSRKARAFSVHPVGTRLISITLIIRMKLSSTAHIRMWLLGFVCAVAICVFFAVCLLVCIRGECMHARLFAKCLLHCD
jgi:hypothetical protein